jgi:hypothetical protein
MLNNQIRERNIDLERKKEQKQKKKKKDTIEMNSVL